MVILRDAYENLLSGSFESFYGASKKPERLNLPEQYNELKNL